ncbi:MAG: hypothetical protein LRZ88_05045 [Candidatus Cloacimonetes bacterium]|nr:hypothetical protein [Candidatus Cloacimonadota bacterium]
MRSSAILRLLVLSLILSTAPLAALMPDSAFLPQIRSMKRSSLLSQNPNYQVPNCPLRDEGLSHPFRSMDSFLDHLKSAPRFRTNPSISFLTAMLSPVSRQTSASWLVMSTNLMMTGIMAFFTKAGISLPAWAKG